jgi:hypothetical protein
MPARFSAKLCRERISTICLFGQNTTFRSS